MQTIIVNLKSLYPEHYKEDMLIEIATEIFEIIESYIFRRILCKIPTNALNKVFMSLSKEIKREENIKIIMLKH